MENAKTKRTFFISILAAPTCVVLALVAQSEVVKYVLLGAGGFFLLLLISSALLWRNQYNKYQKVLSEETIDTPSDFEFADTLKNNKTSKLDTVRQLCEQSLDKYKELRRAVSELYETIEAKIEKNNHQQFQKYGLFELGGIRYNTSNYYNKVSNNQNNIEMNSHDNSKISSFEALTKEVEQSIEGLHASISEWNQQYAQTVKEAGIMIPEVLENLNSDNVVKTEINQADLVLNGN